MTCDYISQIKDLVVLLTPYGIGAVTIFILVFFRESVEHTWDALIDIGASWLKRHD